MPVTEIGLLTPSVGFKPFRYGWAYDLWKRQQQVHWMPEEVSLGEDIKDWNGGKLNEAQKGLLTHIFRFFTQSDMDVQDNYMEQLARVFKPHEIKMMLAANANIETIHVDAYALLIETVGMPETEYQAFLEYSEMKEKHDFVQGFVIDPADPRTVLRNLAVFGAFTEGLQLFASFAMLMNFPRFGLMKGMGQIVSWSIRDESLHCEGIIKLFHAYAQETGALDNALKEEITQIALKIVELEDKFIDLAHELGGSEGATADDYKLYIRFICDWRLQQLGLQPQWGITEHPLPWLPPLINGVEHANFFETRATEYSKGATRGDWKGVWDTFDKKRENSALEA